MLFSLFLCRRNLALPISVDLSRYRILCADVLHDTHIGVLITVNKLRMHDIIWSRCCHFLSADYQECLVYP